MASVNKVIIIGNLGRNPEVRTMSNGDSVANIAVATTDTWKDKTTGEKKEATEWHQIVFYRKLAEIVGKYLKKGALIYIEGRLQNRKWTDKDGIERYTTEIIADTMKMLGSRPAGTGQDDSPQADDEANGKEGSEHSAEWLAEYDRQMKAEAEAAAKAAKPATPRPKRK